MRKKRPLWPFFVWVQMRINRLAAFVTKVLVAVNVVLITRSNLT